MEENINTNYQLLNMADRARQELIESTRQEANEKFSIFQKRFYEKIHTYKAKAKGDIISILALNHLLQREYNQHEAFSLEGMEAIVEGVRDKTLLANNNFVFGKSEIATSRDIYLVVEPDIASEEDTEVLSLEERIVKATEEYDLDNVPYKLYFYINTEKYDIFAALEEEIRASTSKEYEIVCELPNIEIRSTADVVVNVMPEVSVEDMVNSFYSSFDLFAARRKKVFFDYKSDVYGKTIGKLDFLLLAHSHLSNLLIPKETLQPLARHFTSIWLDTNQHFKFRNEEIEDFFQSPSVVLITGLSPVYGVIASRKIEIIGTVINSPEGKEERIKYEIDSDSEIGGVYEYQEAMDYLLKSPKNLRSRLVKFRDEVIRVDRLEKSIVVVGHNKNSTKKIKKYVISGDKMQSVVFLTPFYRADFYNKLVSGYKSAVPYKLPERFKTYLLRLASAKGVKSPSLDCRWFSDNNNAITDILDAISGKFSIDRILGHSISPIDGILTKTIMVNLEGLKCHTEEN